jgi:DNA modification methylase
MKIETLAIKDLTLDPQNARQHDAKNLKAIEGSLSQFGQRKPIVITEANVIVAGNGTVTAAKNLGWEKIEAVRVPADWSKDQVKAFALADNRTAELAIWSPEVLAAQLIELQDAGFEIAEFGFDKIEPPIDPDSLDEDVIPEPPANPVTKLGDLWQLGSHRLLCGDSTDSSQIDKLMDGNKADMVFTDPPYGMFLDTDYSDMESKFKGSTGGNKYDAVIGDNSDFHPSLIDTIFENFSYVNEIFIWGADYFAEHLPNKNTGSWVVWDKRGNESSDKMFGSVFELCWSKARHKREIARIKWAGIFGLEKEHDKKRQHPTQKPVMLAQWFLEKWGKDAKNVVDLYLGSGSTLLACQHSNKSCYGMELDPKYCDVIIKRWETLTGQKAELVNATR